MKKESPGFLLELSLGGDYLLSHFRSTIGVVRLNFSVRNGKRWDPHAIITLVSLSLASCRLIYSNRNARCGHAASDALKSCDGNATGALERSVADVISR